MVLANLKDNIDRFEAQNMMKNAENVCGHQKFDVVVEHIANDASVF